MTFRARQSRMDAAERSPETGLGRIREQTAPDAESEEHPDHRKGRAPTHPQREKASPTP